ncbi:biopolymer transporter ExbD [Puniceicoccaceae bacterium K14]|nr:biopolymer transporter ExbD [Puniceicoccaceae bacterium K14]
MQLLKLNLETEAPKPARLGFWPFVDLCVIGLFFAMFGSKFVVAPGINIELPELGSTMVSVAEKYEVLTVNEVEGKEMIMFQGTVLNLSSMRRLLKLRGKVPEGVTLLVRSDASVSMRTWVSLSEIASEAGYSHIQLATEKREEVELDFMAPRN